MLATQQRKRTKAEPRATGLPEVVELLIGGRRWAMCAAGASIMINLPGLAEPLCLTRAEMRDLRFVGKQLAKRLEG